MRPVYPPPSLTQRCTSCGASVEADQEYCEAAVCQTKARVSAAQLAAAKSRRADEREANLARRRTTKLLRTAARRSGAKDLGQIAFAVVPHVRGDTAPRTEERDKVFLKHLDAVIAEAFAEAPKEVREFSHEETPDDDFTNWYDIVKDDPLSLAAACISCQGDCCFWGNASNAFLTPNTISWLRHQNPDITPDEIRSAYVNKMPTASVPDSCVFHGPEGCTLSRNMRADVCNRWQCRYRRRLEQQIERKGARRSVVAGLPRDHYLHPENAGASVKIVTVNERNGVQVHRDLALPALRFPKNA